MGTGWPRELTLRKANIIHLGSQSLFAEPEQNLGVLTPNDGHADHIQPMAMAFGFKNGESRQFNDSLQDAGHFSKQNWVRNSCFFLFLPPSPPRAHLIGCTVHMSISKFLTGW